jgi:hypothetical protein
MAMQRTGEIMGHDNKNFKLFLNGQDITEYTDSTGYELDLSSGLPFEIPRPEPLSVTVQFERRGLIRRLEQYHIASVIAEEMNMYHRN